MSNIVTFQPKERPVGSADFVQNVEHLLFTTIRIRWTVESSRSLATCLRRYGEWLRRYYEIDGGIKAAWRPMEEYLRVHGSEADTVRLDEIVKRMAQVEDLAKGPHPWLALPSGPRFKIHARSLLIEAGVALTSAIGTAKAIGRPTLPPTGGAA